MSLEDEAAGIARRRAAAGSHTDPKNWRSWSFETPESKEFAQSCLKHGLKAVDIRLPTSRRKKLTGGWKQKYSRIGERGWTVIYYADGYTRHGLVVNLEGLILGHAYEIRATESGPLQFISLEGDVRTQTNFKLICGELRAAFRNALAGYLSA